MHFTRGTSSLFQPFELERITCEPDELQDLLRDLDGGDNSWWCAGTFATGAKRSKAAWIGTGSLVPLDLDTKTTDGKKALPAAEDWFVIMEAVRQGAWPWVQYAHTTPHGVRVVGVLSEPVKDAEAYGAIVDAMAAEMAGAINATAFHLDLGSREPWRAMFAPGARVNGVARAVGMVDELRPAFEVDAFDVAACLEARTVPAAGPKAKAGRTIGGSTGGTSDTNAARKAWLIANPLGETFTRGDCPLCGHHECFQVDGESRWFCYSTNCGSDGPSVVVGRVLPEGTRCGDAFDLAMFERGLGDRELLVADGFLKVNTPPDEDESDGKAPILLPGAFFDGAQDIVQTLNHFVDEATTNMPADLLFRSGDRLVKLDLDAAKLAPITPAQMAHLIDANCFTYRWLKNKNQQPKAVYHVVPGQLAAQVVETTPMLPHTRPVNNVVRHPVMARDTDDGFRICPEGYDAAARVYTLPHGIDVQDDMDAAMGRTVLEDLLVDYPFVSEADRQNAIALMITQVARLSLDIAPMFYVGASQAGTGKSLLLNSTLSMAVTGEPANAATFKSNEEEMRKYLESVLLAGESFAVIDNVPEASMVNSASLAGVLTMQRINMRILGETKEASATNKMTMAISGNNIRFSAELARRTMPILLHTTATKPEERGGFQHPHAGTYAKQRRALVLSAIISAATRWRMLGCPEPIGMPKLGSFEQWRNVVVGIMQHGLGYDQVLTNQAAFMDKSGDGVRSDLWELVKLMHTQFGAGEDNAKKPAPIYRLIDEADLFATTMGKCRSEDPQRRANYMRDTVLQRNLNVPTDSGYSLTTDDRGATWYLSHAGVAKQVEAV